MRLAPPLCCKLLRQVPTFFIIMKRLEALESSWEFKKKTTKNKTTRAHNCFHCHHCANRELERADRQRHQLSAAILVFLLHFGFVSLHTLTKKKGVQRAVLPPWRRDTSWVCLQCTICQQPKTCFCLRSQLDGSLCARGSEELTPRQEPFCGARRVISSGSVPCSYSDCFQTAPSVGRENERLPAEQRVYISSITRLHF